SIMNFLPWRQQRRARCLRFWGAMGVGTVLLMFVIMSGLRMNPLMRLYALQTDLTGMQTVQHALHSWQKLASQAQMPAQTLQRRAWQPVQGSLSRAMPAQVWLTELRYQP
ncbi:PilN domain-containing protein, partial [Raoultella ornithinolytica]|uniref:PilN domain-containing protein n=1 Tax=Raoultella ornithinolytica TaxID=54291 RepID=UPI003F1D0BAC